MNIVGMIANGALALREFFWPSYRPERHYMRGPGPACARTRSFGNEAGAL